MSPNDDAGGQADLLGEMRVLRRRARAARHAYWFPLVLFGVLTCASVPFYLQLNRPAGAGTGAAVPGPQLPFLGGAFAGSAVQHDLGYYWLAALLGGLLLTLLWYRRNARRVGLQTPARGYVITVAVLTALALVVPLLSRVRSPHWLSWLQHLQVLWPSDLVVRGTFPFIIIAAGLWALAWAERSRALVVIAAVYSGAALLASLYNVENLLFRLGWNPGPGDLELTALPNVLLPAIVLLATGAGAFVVQRRREPAAA
ncbi:MAG TPA: hypothetical protein VGI21_03435 [Streptosporangiaceae bacterium]|jgi:hypothetical protein